MTIKGIMTQSTDTAQPVEAPTAKVEYLTRLSHLRVKIKSLAAEANIIRNEEKRYSDYQGDVYTGERQSLQEHRKGIVRQTMRESLLAYGFLRGLSLREIEGPNLHPVKVKKPRNPAWPPPTVRPPRTKPRTKKERVPPDWKKVEDTVKRFGIQAPTSYSKDVYHAYMSAKSEEAARFKAWMKDFYQG